MSSSSATAAAVEAPTSIQGAGGRHRGRWRWALAGAAVVLVTAGVVLAVIDPFSSRGNARSGVVDNAYPTSLATVTRQSISSTTPANATLGYAGNYTVVNQARGTVTWLPGTGQLVRQGQVLYRVDGNPVVLLYGPTPAYRTLSQGATGADVRELNADLVALGYARASELSPRSNHFGRATANAVEKLQAHLGVTQTGTLSLGQAVFLPTVARVTTVSATLGGPAGPGQPVLTATSTTREVTINLDAAQQSEVRVGDRVAITLPDNSSTPGVISSVGSVASIPSSGGSNGSGGPGGSGNGTPTVTVEVTPTKPAATGILDQAPVEVAITNATVPDALVVRVDALIALSGGGYALEVVNPDGVHRLVDVNLGIFDNVDGLVQVSGSGLAAGQHVVVPAT